MQANLALLGFESHVQRVTLDDDVFNRVRIGPITDLEAAKRTQRQLRTAGYDTMLTQLAIKVRALHADALGELADLAAAEQQLLLQVGSLEVLARFAQRHRQEVL